MEIQNQPLVIITNDDDEYFEDSSSPINQSPPTNCRKSPAPALAIDYTIDTIDTSNPITVVCIDVDQTIGDVSIASIFYRIWQHNNMDERGGPPYHTVRWFFEAGGFRPYLKELMLYLHRLRATGRLEKILIHTSLTRKEYVEWIVSCLENYCGLDQLIDGIRDGNSATAYSKCGATIKNLEPTDILIDDKPWNAIPNTRVLKVAPYYCTIDGSPYIDFFPEDQKKSVTDIINYDRRANAAECDRSPLHSDDNDLEKILLQLKSYFK